MTSAATATTTVLRSVPLLAVAPGDILHDQGGRLVVLAAGIKPTRDGWRYCMSRIPISAIDARATQGLASGDTACKLDAAAIKTASIEHRAETPDRYYVACAVNDSGKLVDCRIYRAGEDCSVCAWQPHDPAPLRHEPCQNPRSHARTTLESWDFNSPSTRHILLAPRATSRKHAEERATDACERIRTLGHL